MLSVLGIGLVVVFVVSRVVTDRFEWSQWVWWAPAWWFVVVGWGLLAGSMLVGWIGKRRGWKGRGLVLRAVLLVGCVGMVMNVAFGVRRYQNGIGGYGIHWTRAAQDDRIRVLHWNIAAGEFDVPRAIQWIDQTNADIVLIANPRWDGQRNELAEGLNGIARNQATVRRLSRAMIMSRYEIVSTSMIYLSTDAEDESETTMRPTGGFGWIALITLDRAQSPDAEPELFDVWFVDLPSEPTTHRMESMHAVVEKLHTVEPPRSPALIIGDFNTVRGSASLKKLDVFADGSGFIDAFKARGSMGGSWQPSGLTGIKGWIAEHASWHIDLSLVNNNWSIDGYELVAPDWMQWGNGVSHKAQVVDIER